MAEERNKSTHEPDSLSHKKIISLGVVTTSPSNARGAGSIPGGGVKVPHASQSENQNKTEAIL